MSDIEVVKVTFDPKKLPNVKSRVESWMQLTKVEETESSITMKGRDHVVSLMLGEIHFYAKRHKQTVTVQWPTRKRHDWEYVKDLGRNKLYRCKNCGEETEGDLELVMCPPDCQEEIHFCKSKRDEYI